MGGRGARGSDSVWAVLTGEVIIMMMMTSMTMVVMTIMIMSTMMSEKGGKRV